MPSTPMPLDTTTISAEPSLSTSATAGYSIRVPLMRGAEKTASPSLSNAQIVLGSLMSRLYFVIVLLMAGLPVFCVMMLYGGVTLRGILLSVGLCGSTAGITRSLARSFSGI